MPAKKKRKKKTKAKGKVGARRARRAAGPTDFVARVAEQLAGGVGRGLKRLLEKVPSKGGTDAAREKIKEALKTVGRQAEALRDRAEDLAARGAEGPARAWRELVAVHERAMEELRNRLAKR
jgi:hypothetical protein